MRRAEQRQTRRFAKRLLVKYRAPGKGTWRRAFSGDLAASGLFIIARQIPAHSAVEIEVTLPDRSIIPLRGSLVRGKKVPPHLQQVIKGGFAVALDTPPQAWIDLCQRLGGG